MARETKAQRLVREQAEREARLEAERQAYPVRLMKTFERLNNQHNTELKVSEGFFVATLNSFSRSATEYTLSYSYTEDAQSVLQDLEWDLDELEQAQAEEKRRSEVRREAQRKAEELFTKEERELLGL